MAIFLFILGVLALRPSHDDLRVLACVLSSVAIFLIISFMQNGDPSKSLPLLTVLVLVNGTLIRLVLAWFFEGNYDSVCWQVAASRFHQGLDPYTGNDRYNYTPVWFWILGGLKSIHRHLPQVSFHFIFCSFLTLVDLATFFVLARIVKKNNISTVIPAIFFYFNPISFLLTGYHGQIENFAILSILLGLAAYLFRQGKEGPIFFWAGCALGAIIKHIVFFQLIIAVNAGFRKVRVRLFFLFLSAAVFFLFLVPYWNIAREYIIKNVLVYSSHGLPYGFAAFYKFKDLKWVFITAIILYPWMIRKFSLERQMLLMMLFFLVFTTGVGVQYFILPVALGALMPSMGFCVYSLVTTFFLLGSYFNLYIASFNFIPWNAVWAAALVWFVLEWRRGLR